MSILRRKKNAYGDYYFYYHYCYYYCHYYSIKDNVAFRHIFYLFIFFINLVFTHL
jgi:hypothetical protein